jgi:hypothetical protein
MTGTTCPQEIRAKNHKAAMPDVWNDPVYQAVESEFLHENPICEYCHRPSNVAHHDEDWAYRNKDEYYKKENMTPACNICHWMYRRRYVVCPECLKAGEVHYMMKGSDSCSRHRKYTPKHRNKRHSCDWNNGNQRCGNPLRHDRICPHSSRKAKDRCDPDYFTARKIKGVRA